MIFELGFSDLRVERSNHCSNTTHNMLFEVFLKKFSFVVNIGMQWHFHGLNKHRVLLLQTTSYYFCSIFVEVTKYAFFLVKKAKTVNPSMQLCAESSSKLETIAQRVDKKTEPPGKRTSGDRSSTEASPMTSLPLSKLIRLLSCCHCILTQCSCLYSNRSQRSRCVCVCVL